MIKLYIFSKKIHRLLALIVAILASIMTVTGLSMKYGWFLDPITARVIHNLFSLYFVIALVPMGLTGLVMFVFPYWQKQKNKTVNKASNPL